VDGSAARNLKVARGGEGAVRAENGGGNFTV
jgi:hypothetical protein